MYVYGLTLKWVSGKTGPHHAKVGNCHLSVTVRETIVKRTNIEKRNSRTVVLLLKEKLLCCRRCVGPRTTTAVFTL